MSQSHHTPTDPPPEVSTFIDADGVSITVHTWPVAHPHAIVQIAHGIGEHALRYQAFAERLQRAGFTVIAQDHRGHGATGLEQWGGDTSKLGRLGPGGLRAAEAAICAVTANTRDAHPNTPIIMFAHSWGSLMVQRIINHNPELYDAVILSGSAYRTPTHMESGDLNRAWRSPTATGFEWLSRDPATARAFIADPLCFPANVLKLFGLADGLRLFGVPTRASARTPLLIVSGSADPISRGAGLKKLAQSYRDHGARDVTLKLYPEARHELLNELNRDAVTADIITWILERFPPNEEQA